MGSKESFEGRTCECCGNGDFLAGVASSGIGAFSILWCEACIFARAEPLWAIEVIVEECGGVENVPEHFILIYYDKEKDEYTNYRTKEVFAFHFKDNTVCNTRKEFLEYASKFMKGTEKSNEKSDEQDI